MWLVTRVGLLSVVQAGPEPGSKPDALRRLMVRARSRQHLELLKRDHPVLRSYPIIESEPHRDYRWRLIVPRATLSAVVAKMVDGINYANFKSTCASAPELEPGYIGALHAVWGSFRRLQEPRAP